MLAKLENPEFMLLAVWFHPLRRWSLIGCGSGILPDPNGKRWPPAASLLHGAFSRQYQDTPSLKSASSGFTAAVSLCS